MRKTILWFTGLSGSGKTTLANEVAKTARRTRPSVQILDGDEMRAVFKNTGFSKEDRDQNIRQIAFVAQLLARHNVFVITATISPYYDTREEIRKRIELDDIVFIEVFLDTPIEALVARDPKGLYRRALNGEIQHFTGVSDPYQPPIQPEICISTHDRSIAEASALIANQLRIRGLL